MSTFPGSPRLLKGGIVARHEGARNVETFAATYERPGRYDLLFEVFGAPKGAASGNMRNGMQDKRYRHRAAA